MFSSQTPLVLHIYSHLIDQMHNKYSLVNYNSPVPILYFARFICGTGTINDPYIIIIGTRVSTVGLKGRGVYIYIISL